MISGLDGSLGSRYFLNVANERTCFASCVCAVKSSRLSTCLECTSDYLVTTMFLSRLNEINGGCGKILLPVFI